MAQEKLSIDRIPPQNIEAESALLGSLIIEDAAISNALEILTESDIYNDAHKKIFGAIVRLFNTNRAVDLVTLTEELTRAGEIEAAGGPVYLAQISSSIPTAANARHYAKIVKEKSLLRHLIQAATQIVQDGYGRETDVAELLDEAERKIFEITSKHVESRSYQMKDLIKGTIDTIERLYQRKEFVTGIPTGFHEFDSRTAGLQPSDFIVVAGRPSMGKSAFVTSIAEHAGITEKMPIAIFSLEMSKEQLVQRMVCSHARVDVHKARTGFLSQSDWPKLTTAAGRLSETSIYIDDSPSISVLELRAKARRLKSSYDIKLIILDYLQLMQGPMNVENRQQEISEISRSLKALARELNVPLVAVSQLSRAVEMRKDHRPQLSDLRESGAIEQDADLVVLILREEYYNPTEETKGLAEVNIAKQRNGPVGSFTLAFIKEFARFENLTRREE